MIHGATVRTLLSPTGSPRSRRSRPRLDRIRVFFRLTMCPLRRRHRRRLARPRALDGNNRRWLLLLHFIFLLHMDPLRRVLLLHDSARALCGRYSRTRLGRGSGSRCPPALRSALRPRPPAPVFRLRNRLAFPAPSPGGRKRLGWIVVIGGGGGVARLWLDRAPLGCGGSRWWCHVHICRLTASRSPAYTLRGLGLWFGCSGG